MNRLKVFFVLAILVLITPAVFAQATRTWVSGVGDDVNPCSRTAPCKTFPGAQSKTADGGEINALDPGGFGAITIVKSLTIDGYGQMAGILHSGGINGVVINAPGEHVILRNITIDGANSGLRGVSIVSAASVTIENVSIFGHTTEGVRDLRTTAGTLYMKNVQINGGQYGVLIQAAVVNEATLDNVSARNASIAGVRVSGGQARIHIVDSNFSNNATGVLADNGVINIERSSAVYNNDGVTASTGATVRLSECFVSFNTNGVQAAGGGIVETFGHNRIRGNTNFNGAGMTGVLEQ